MGKAEFLPPFRLEVWQDVFPVGEDSLALGQFATLRPGFRVCDLGAGSGLLLLLLARREEHCTLHGVERAPRAADNARYNLAQNGLTGEIVTGDLRDHHFPAGHFHLVVSNPPYFPPGSGKPGVAARHERDCALDELCAAAARLLRNGGRFALCHPPRRLVDLFCALRSCGLEPKRLQPLAHREGGAPSTVLVEAVRQGKPGLELLPTRIRTAAPSP